MNETKMKIVAVLAPLFKERGYTKKGATWHLANAETIRTFNIQKSQWGDAFYFNLGVLIRSLDDCLTPAEVGCHLRTRLTELIPNRANLVSALSFKTPPATWDSRIQEIEEATKVYGLPWLDALSSFRAISDYLRSDKAKQELISQPLLRRVYASLEVAYPWPDKPPVISVERL